MPKIEPRSGLTGTSYKFEVEVILHDNMHAEFDGSPKRIRPLSVNKMLKGHIEQAVAQWGGQLYKQHVLFSTNVYAVRVKNKHLHVPHTVTIKPQQPRARTGTKKGTRLKNDVNTRQR